MDLPINKVKNLYYKKGLSAEKIGKELRMSTWQVLNFMKKNNLPRRNQAESNRLSFLSSSLSFKKKSPLTIRDNKLKIAGLMLYCGEGVKVGDDTVDIANCDQRIIQLFLKMLRKLYGIREKKLRILLYCYANQNIKELINYWSKITGIKNDQFYKPYVRQDFLESKKNKMPYGLVHVRYSDKRLVSLIKLEIEKLFNEMI